jgi:hypothetical protein
VITGCHFNGTAALQTAGGKIETFVPVPKNATSFYLRVKLNDSTGSSDRASIKVDLYK